MDDEEFEKNLNKEKSFINTSKNHTAEFEKQLGEQKKEYEVRNETKSLVEETKKYSDVLVSKDLTPKGKGGIVGAIIGIIICLGIGTWAGIKVMSDGTSGTLNITGITELVESEMFSTIPIIIVTAMVLGMIVKFLMVRFD